MVIFLITAVAVIIADQLTKIWAVSALYNGDEINILPGIIRFTYVENKGAAFGMLSDSRWIFMAASCVAIVGICVYMFKTKPKSKLLVMGIGLIIGGGIGNMIDRFRLSYVVDFIDFTFVRFYVFNVADSCVCIGCGLVALYVLLDALKEKRIKKNGNADVR